jgi:hypothetical protein
MSWGRMRIIGKSSDIVQIFLIIRDEQGIRWYLMKMEPFGGDIYALALLKVTIFYLKIFPPNAHYEYAGKIFLQKQMNLISRKFL